jgi:hypothetical protein
MTLGGDQATVAIAPAAPLNETVTVPPTTATSSIVTKCSQTETPLTPAPQSLHSFQQLIVRRWLLCGQTSTFGTTEAGLDIAADGSWYKLVSGADGSIERATGFDRQGTWEIIDTSAMNGKPTFQLNLSIFGSGTVIVTPQFAADPLKTRLNNNGVFVADYLAA